MRDADPMGAVTTMVSTLAALGATTRPVPPSPPLGGGGAVNPGRFSSPPPLGVLLATPPRESVTPARRAR